MYDELSDGDDDKLMPQVFAVDYLREDVQDTDAPPTSGQEYLQRVMKEARRVPSIVVADIDSHLLQTNQRVSVQLCSSLHPAPGGYAPSLAWQNQQVFEFAQVRQNFARYKARLRRDNIKKSRMIPFKDDGEAWCMLCFGKRNVRSQWRACNNRGELQFKTAPSTGTDDEGDRLAGEKRNLHGAEEHGTPPLLSIVSYMNQMTVTAVLKYHFDWMTVTGFTTEQGRWFYALLACLEKPLDPDSCSLLRDLARACSSLRATLDSVDDERLTQLNLIICLVARYFSQTDLADP